VVDYQEALFMQERVATARREGTLDDDVLFLLEHPPTITIGRQGSTGELLAGTDTLEKMDVRVYDIGRGGRLTYHGPGQLVGYPIIDLRCHGRDLHQYLRRLEETLIRSLRSFGIEAGRKEGLTGVWVGEDKIASIGIQVKRWVTMHGFALNVSPNMKHFQLLQPCGFSADVMTSMQKLTGEVVDMGNVLDSVREAFVDVFCCDTVPISISSLRTLL
jgi:lipoic acid synthetase